MSYGQLVRDVGGLSIPTYDYVGITPPAAPTNGDQVLVYRIGGSSGTVVATLTLTYVSGELSSVARS
jgi:hypothetical protein